MPSSRVRDIPAWHPDDRQTELNLPDHRSADEYFERGRLLQARGSAAEAVAHYKHALVLDPEHPTAAYNLGTAYEDLNDSTRAIRAYRKAIAADPAFADAHFNLGRLYEKAGRKRDALKHMRMYRNLR